MPIFFRFCYLAFNMLNFNDYKIVDTTKLLNKEKDIFSTDYRKEPTLELDAKYTYFGYYSIDYSAVVGWRSTTVNAISTALVLPLDAGKLIVCTIFNGVMIAVQLLYNSPSLIYFGFYRGLHRLDDYLAGPPPEAARKNK